MNYESRLLKILELQEKIADIHSLFLNAYPIAIAEGDLFFIFDLVDGENSYRLVKEAPTPMPIPVGVRAAFNLECYDNRNACVVTGEVFDSLAGYATVFHEFVHCYQASTCESKLKQTLAVARQAMAAGNYMWEIEHPFPYSSLDFTEAYKTLLKAIDGDAGEVILQAHGQLSGLLERVDFEYLVWQEWKEGFARLFENRIHKRLNLPENHYGRELPYHRITFYEGGAGLIADLEKASPGLTCDLEKLFWSMLQT